MINISKKVNILMTTNTYLLSQRQANVHDANDANSIAITKEPKVRWKTNLKS